MIILARDSFFSFHCILFPSGRAGRQEQASGLSRARKWKILPRTPPAAKIFRPAPQPEAGQNRVKGRKEGTAMDDAGWNTPEALARDFAPAIFRLAYARTGNRHTRCACGKRPRLRLHRRAHQSVTRFECTGHKLLRRLLRLLIHRPKRTPSICLCASSNNSLMRSAVGGPELSPVTRIAGHTL